MSEHWSLVSTIERLEAAARAGRWGDIDAEFSNIDVAGESSEIMVCKLRSTVAFLERIPSWESFYGRAREELTRRGIDTSRTLRGLEEALRKRKAEA